MAIFKEHNFNPMEHDRTIEDRSRHRELVEKAIKENLGDILSEESIIGEGSNKKIKIPIRGLKEYQFIYGKNVPGVGSGDGSEKKGDIIGSDKAVGGKSGKGAGDEEEEDVYETEITIEEVLNYLIEDLELPNMDNKKFSTILTQSSKKKSGFQKHGINPRLSKKRTVVEKIKRRQSQKRALKELNEPEKIERFPFKKDDLRYFRVKQIYKRESNAAIICIMDVSGSMDNTKKYMARSFYFVLSRFIRMKYNNVEIAFVSHSTTAKEVNEKEFFHRGESGGTFISSGLNKAIEIIEDRYSPSNWNVYSFYVSDGDNWIEDNERAVESAKKLCRYCNMFGYAEILPGVYANIKDLFDKQINRKNFITVTINQKQELWMALKSMLLKELDEG